MKRSLLLLLISFFSSSLRAQVVFCPSGAEWHYALGGAFGSSNVSNIRIKYVRDSVMNQVSYKVLQHPYFFASKCSRSDDAKVTLIKQDGDTVFFRNRNTDHAWQVLYNYAALAGQSWTTAIYESNIPTKVYTITVQSVSTVTINSIPLRKLNVINLYPLTLSMGPTVYTYSTTITERIGSNACLFNFMNSMFGGCDLAVFAGNLCYQDDSLGVFQYSPSRNCDYTFVGIQELEQNNARVDIYPNPGSSSLNVSISGSTGRMTDFRILNSLGQFQEIQVKETSSSSNYQLKIQDLPSGIYSLQIFNQDKLFSVKKFVKE